MFRALKDGHDQQNAKVAKAILPLVPLFFLKCTGKFDMEINPDNVKDFIGVEPVEIAFQNARKIAMDKAKKKN